MVFVSREPFTSEWSHLWFSDVISLRPIVIEDVNNCLKMYSSCKSFLLLCSPSKSLVLKASLSSRETVELASGSILRFSRLCWSMLCPASSGSLGLWPEVRQTWTAYSTIPGHSQAFVMLVFTERGVKIFPYFESLTLQHVEIIKCTKDSGPLQGCYLSFSVSAQPQSLCEGPKSAMHSNAPAAGPAWMNTGHGKEVAHVYGRNVGFLLSKVHAPCVSERRGLGRWRTMHGAFLFALRYGAALCYKGKCS